jgi:hypothetical protein
MKVKLFTNLKNHKNEKKDEKQTGIWIDSTKAIIVSLEDGKSSNRNTI